MRKWNGVAGNRWLRLRSWYVCCVLYVLFFISANVQPNNIAGQKRKCVFQAYLCVCVFQGEKECLNSETTELKQKIRYLQDQLLPLSKQREYQEKEIQRLNRVSVEHLWNTKKTKQWSAPMWSCWIFLALGFGRSLKPSFTFILPTTTWPG